MKKLSILTITMIALSGFMATTVRAQNAHYINGPTGSLSGNDYCVSFKEAGLGSTPVTYTIAAGTGTTFTYQCYTKSNNTPQGAPNSVSGSGQTSSITITPHNGQTHGTFCISPEQDGASCQGNGLVLRLIAVDWDHVTFTDTATNMSYPVQDLCNGPAPYCED